MLFALVRFSQYPELVVASYNNNEDAPHEPDGVALVWNIKFKKATPEYIFHCQVFALFTHKSTKRGLNIIDFTPFLITCNTHQAENYKFRDSKGSALHICLTL